MRAWRTWFSTVWQAPCTERTLTDSRNFEFSTGRDYSRGLFF